MTTRRNSSRGDVSAGPAPALERRESLDRLLKAIRADTAHDGTLLGTGGVLDEANRLLLAVSGAWTERFPLVPYSDGKLYCWLAAQGVTPAQAGRMPCADVVAMLQSPAADVPKRDPPPARRHSPDYRSVAWDGETYSFTRNQALCVKALWKAWEIGRAHV